MALIIGERYGNLDDSSGILSSRDGFNELLGMMRDEDEFRLTIINCFDI